MFKKSLLAIVTSLLVSELVYSSDIDKSKSPLTPYTAHNIYDAVKNIWVDQATGSLSDKQVSEEQYAQLFSALSPLAGNPGLMSCYLTAVDMIMEEMHAPELPQAYSNKELSITTRIAEKFKY